MNWQDGYIIPSNEPGLGFELNETLAAAHPYKEDKLHLEPQNTPLIL